MDTQQLGFDGLLASAAEDNRLYHLKRRTTSLPGDMSAGIPYFKALIIQIDEAVRAQDWECVQVLDDEAHDLALKLNGFDPGILAHDDAPGYELARMTAADPGTVPLWGQAGEFTITIDSHPVRIEMRGIFAIGSLAGFTARGVNNDQPFPYRSFISSGVPCDPDMTPESFAYELVRRFVDEERKAALPRKRRKAKK